jgi:hypothetical protein
MFDNHHNQIDRYEDADHQRVELRITRSHRSPLDEAAITLWYWRYVGTAGIATVVTPIPPMAEMEAI